MRHQAGPRFYTTCFLNKRLNYLEVFGNSPMLSWSIDKNNASIFSADELADFFKRDIHCLDTVYHIRAANQDCVR